MPEVELKFLAIDVAATERKLLAFGARKEFESAVVDVAFTSAGFHPWDTTQKSLRLRTMNEKASLTLKGPREPGRIKIREETEVEIGDRETILRILGELGFRATKEHHKHRVHYTKGTTSFEIDTVPGIPTYLEIETPSVAEMQSVCTALELRLEDGHGKTITELYPGMPDL